MTKQMKSKKKIEVLKIKIGLEVQRMATEEAEKIIAGKLYEAEELLKLHFERVSRKFGSEIADAIWKEYSLVKK